MVSGPLRNPRLHGTVSAVAVDDQNALEAAVRHGVEYVAYDAQVRGHPQRDRAGEFAEVGRDAVRDDGEDWNAQRLRRFHGDALGENAIDGQAQMTVLLGASER